MKILILCPGKIAKSLGDIKCFTDVLNYYLPQSLSQVADTTVLSIPDSDGDQLKKLFLTLKVDQYDAIITLGLRFYSKISNETTQLLRTRFNGLFCQVHDGTRLDQDPVDITFTFKNDDNRLKSNEKRLARHKKFNEYMGWATDPKVNKPRQISRNLGILVDHTNYGDNIIDRTQDVLTEIKKFVDSKIWASTYDTVSVRRFDSGRVVDVDFDNLDIKRYDRTPIPFTEITKEHCVAHIFCVTHPESVGLVVLETAMAGALPVVPKGFVPQDRLDTVRHIQWENHIDWNLVLGAIDTKQSREVALKNTWDAAANRIYNALNRRLAEKGNQND